MTAAKKQKTGGTDHPLLRGCGHIESGNTPDWVTALRETAAESFAVTGLPTPAWEDWKYTALRALDNMDFARDTGLSAVPDYHAPFALPEMISLRILGGRLVKNAAELPRGLEIHALKDVWHEDWVAHYLAVPGNFADTPLEALNAACLCDGIVIRVAAGTRIEAPVLLSFLHENTDAEETQLSMPRILIAVEEGAALTMIEHHTGRGKYFTNQAATITVHKGAKLGHYRWQDEDKQSGFHITTTRLSCFDGAEYDGFTLTTGAKLSRHEIFADLLGEEIRCILNGAYRLGERQHTDTTLKTGHFEPRSTSKQIYKGVLNDQARAVFQGKIHVHRHAQGTDGHQLNHALLLSGEAEIDAKPELEIYADDVKCAHGATSGKLDDQALFYLKSRGIPENTAKDMLIEAFLGEAIEAIGHTAVRDAFLHLQNTAEQEAAA
ncbi:MAG: Fe-S cluster assembly protein SufD [Micavibrio sp.]|nr:MAG: Fe-S cluster assembly protein SufD [Micavibrio sp.]